MDTITLPAPTDPATDAAMGLFALYQLLEISPSAYADWLRAMAEEFDGMDPVGTVEGRA